MVAAAWALVVLAPQPAAARCDEPLGQWCLILGIGGTVGSDAGGEIYYGASANVGTFPLKRFATSVDGGFLSFADGAARDTRYDGGLTARYYIPLGDTFFLVPGYRGGMFWYKSVSGTGLMHGPRASAMFHVGGPLYAGIGFSYDWIAFKSATATQWNVVPAISLAF